MSTPTNEKSITTVENQGLLRIPFRRSVLFQILIVGVISFLAPGLWNATNSLGAGGALLPYLVNGANSIVFALMGLGCIFAPVVINLLTVRKTLVLGTIGWSVYSAALYQNNRYGTEWFVLFAAAICGISAGLYWASEGAIVLSYPSHQTRARYLAMWTFCKNTGQIVGGSITLALNVNNSKGGKVSHTTYIVFIALQCLGLPFACLISNPEKVVRDDGSQPIVEAKTTTREQLRFLRQTVTTAKIGLLLPIFWSSWFYWGYASTFLTLYFSVRARALASLLSAISGALSVALLGLFLDSQRLSLRARVKWGGIFVVSFFSGMLVWAIVVQHHYTHHPPGKLDWTSPNFGRGFGLYVMINVAGNCVQNYLYWIIGSLGDGTSVLARYAGLLRGIESFGQCAAFGINSSKFSPLYTVVINIVFWCASLPPAFFTLNKIGVEGGYFPAAAKLSSAVVPAVMDESDEASRSSDVDDVEKPVGEAEVSQARV